MKEPYQEVRMDVVKFTAEDVIVTSSVPDGYWSETWSQRPNETEPDLNVGW